MQVARRYLSSSAHGVAAFDSVAGWLSKHVRAIPAKASQIRVLDTPDEFYQELLRRSASAKQRVIMSSLYLGTGPHEQALVR